MAENAKATPAPPKVKKKKSRSPSYPNWNLETSIEKARLIYNHEKRNAAPLEVLVSHWGSNAKSSGALQGVATLKYFGLLVELPSGNGARQFKLSDDALRILLDQPESASRLAAIKSAALGPKIHNELWKKYGTELPSDASLRSYLLLEKQFNESAVNSFIKQYKETIKFANLTQGDKLPSLEFESSEEQGKEDAPMDAAKLPPPPTDQIRKGDGTVRDLTFPLVGGGLAVLRAPVPMSEENFDLIEAMLKAMKKAIVKQDEGL